MTRTRDAQRGVVLTPFGGSILDRAPTLRSATLQCGGLDLHRRFLTPGDAGSPTNLLEPSWVGESRVHSCFLEDAAPDTVPAGAQLR